MAGRIAPWFVKRHGGGWLVTGRGWAALLVFAIMLAASLFLLHGITRVVLTPVLIMVFAAFSVGKIDLSRLDAS